jgi:hypothetical protein
MKKLIPIMSLVLLILLASFNAPAELKPAKTASSFLKWYKENMERLNKIPMVLNYASGTSSNGKPYLVDFKGTEKWLTEIKKSTFIGPKFIEKWRKYFVKCDENFKASPQKEGPPAGFEFDFIMLSQDFDEALNNLDKVEVVSEYIRSNNTASVKLKFTDASAINFEFGKENNKWMIQSMEK